jgi:hypothetical protein
MKKFEEGIFSDLRNLKPGVDASLEEPKVSFFFLFLERRREAFAYHSGRERGGASPGISSKEGGDPLKGHSLSSI